MRLLSFCLLLGLLCVGGWAKATGNETPGNNGEYLEDEISGVLIDRTVTLVGLRFFRELMDYRRANDKKSDVNLTVYERPSARWGSLIWVVNGHKELYRNFVSPRLGDMVTIAQEASAQIDERLLKLELERLMSDTFDLDEDEF